MKSVMRAIWIVLRGLDTVLTGLLMPVPSAMTASTEVD